MITSVVRLSENGLKISVSSAVAYKQKYQHKINLEQENTGTPVFIYACKDGGTQDMLRTQGHVLKVNTRAHTGSNMALPNTLKP